jgi:tetratricopeptide (TPR) repeat protein
VTSSNPTDSQSGHQQPFAGQVVAFTGKLSSLARRDAQVLVSRLGGTIAPDVTDRTTMLVVGWEERASEAGSAERTASPAIHRSGKLIKAERVNERSPGRIRIVSENDFCRMAGLQAPAALRQQFYGVRDLRAMYPGLREDHLRYLEKWGLIQSAVRTKSEKYYGFADLRVIRQAAAELQQGVRFRAVLRSLAAAREGQLAFDFRPARSDAQPARVIALPSQKRRAGASIPGTDAGESPAGDATRFFLQAADLDEGDESQRHKAAQAYRRALLADPDLVPAIVNLANIHYGWDQLVEALALYERAIGLEPGCFEARFNLGNVYHDLARYLDAERCYRQALALEPAYPDAHFYLAVTLEKLGRSAEAKPYWREYQRLAPDGEWVELAREFSDEG